MFQTSNLTEEKILQGQAQAAFISQRVVNNVEYIHTIVGNPNLDDQAKFDRIKRQFDVLSNSTKYEMRLAVPYENLTIYLNIGVDHDHLGLSNFNESLRASGKVVIRRPVFFGLFHYMSEVSVGAILEATLSADELKDLFKKTKLISLWWINFYSQIEKQNRTNNLYKRLA